MNRPVVVEHKDGVSHIQLNRPERLNAVNLEVLRELESVLSASARQSQAIILSGAGRTFCAGADLAALRGYVEEPAVLQEFLAAWESVCFRIEECRLPVVAAVHGFAVAGGLELMLCCDVVFASRSAQIGDLHIQNGLIPGGGATVRLPHAVGRLRAMHLLSRPETITAEDAKRMGLVSEVVDESDLSSAARTFALSLTGSRHAAVVAIKKLVRAASGSDLKPRLADERTHLLERLADPLVRQALDSYARTSRDEARNTATADRTTTKMRKEQER